MSRLDGNLRRLRVSGRRSALELRTELEISAPPARVWQVLTDFAAYHEWNPLISAVSGQPKPGAKLSVTLSPPESAEQKLSPEVIVYDEPRELRWVSKLWLRGLYDGEHFFQCRETEEGGTRFVHGENVSGWLVKFTGKRLEHLARGLVYMNVALKRRVETGR
jgi:hypothetical protein